jgi:hypothetical protein
VVNISYYQRQRITHLDGTSIFQNEVDRQNEEEIAALLSDTWQCQICPFGALTTVDWYALRHGRLVGVLELKSRSHEFSKYPTVFLNFRKWIALQIASIGHGCPGIFVVRFTDGVRWCPLSEIDARRMRIGGCTERVKSCNDIEPVIEVPFYVMKRLAGRPIGSGG